MKKLSILITAIISVVFLLNSCDKIEKPYTEPGSSLWNGRKILLLDFTAHRCTYCPDGHREAASLIDNFGEAIVPIAVHCTFQAFSSGTEDDPFNYDFTNEVSLELGGGFGVNGHFQLSDGLPQGAVNSLVSDDTYSPTEWASKVQPFLSLFPEFSIDISNQYQCADSMISSEVTVEALLPAERNIALVVYITESHIFQWQEDHSAEETPVENYEHNHVLRGSMNGTWGECLNPGNAQISESDTYTKNYSIHLGQDWNPDNCSIVAFIYDQDSKEVLQAEESHLIIQ